MLFSKKAIQLACYLTIFYLLFFDSPHLIVASLFTPLVMLLLSYPYKIALMKALPLLLLSDLVLSNYSLGLYPFFLILSSFGIALIKRTLFIDSVFVLPLFVFFLSFGVQSLDLFYLALFRENISFFSTYFHPSFWMFSIGPSFFSALLFSVPFFFFLPKGKQRVQELRLKT